MSLVGLAVLGCGEAGYEELTFDPAKASEIAHAALVSEADLPGTGWSVTGRSELDEEPLGLLDGRCNALQGDLRRIDGRLERTGAGLFYPMPGKPMKEYVVVPPAVYESEADFGQWLTRSRDYVLTLAPKEKRKGRL